MPPYMVSIVAHLTTNCTIRHVRVSVPLLDGRKYFREGDLPLLVGSDLMPLFRPRIQGAGGHEPMGRGNAARIGRLLGRESAAATIKYRTLRYVKATAKPVWYRACSSSWSRTHDDPRQVGDDNGFSYGVA